ncbi:MAG: Na+/H+ antiporter NhaA [Alphaproteobacteria bacterium]
MPVFAVLNAGVALGGGYGAGAEAAGQAAAASWIGLPTIGAFFGLLIGEPLGIVLCVWAAVATGLAAFPRGGNWSGIIGIGCLGGIGFTMALFVAKLAVGTSIELDQAKSGVLAASVVSAVLGFALLARAFADAPPRTASARTGQ